MKALLGLVTLLAWVIPLQALSAENKTTYVKKAHPIKLTQVNNTPDANKPIQISKIISQTSSNAARLDSGRYNSEAYQSRPEEYTGTKYSAEEIKQLIRDYSATYNISPDLPLCLVVHESGFQWNSVNRNSTARGAAQYLIKTWLATDEGKIGRSRFDADASIKAMVKYLAIHKSPKPWVVWPMCPKLTFLNV